MNKWELKNMLEELRTDNTRHTEKTELKTHYRDCMLREKKAVADAAQDEKFCTEHILNKSTDN